MTSLVDPSTLVRKEYQSQAVALRDGRILTGLVVNEDDRTLTVLDSNRQKSIIPRRGRGVQAVGRLADARRAARQADRAADPRPVPLHPELGRTLSPEDGARPFLHTASRRSPRGLSLVSVRFAQSVVNSLVLVRRIAAEPREEDVGMNHRVRGKRAPSRRYLGALIAIAMLARSGSMRAQESKPAARSSPNSATEPLAPVASMAQAAAFLDEVSSSWTRQHKCGTCHANYPYLAARPSLKAPESPAMLEVRQFFETRVAHWDDEDKVAKPRWDAEVVATAAALALNDAATTGRLHPLRASDSTGPGRSRSRKEVSTG